MRSEPRQVNEFDYLITADGEKHNLNTLGGRFVLDSGGHGMPSIEYLTSSGPFQHGQTVLDYFLQPRVLQYIMRFSGENRQSYWDARAELLNWLRPNRHPTTALQLATLRKIFPDGDKRDIKVFIEQGPEFDMRGNLDVWDENGYTQLVRFIAHDPVFFDPDQVAYSWTGTELVDLVFPITFPISFGSSMLSGSADCQYDGTWIEYPIIILVGPLESPTIENITTGEKISLTYMIPTGRTVTIDCSYGQKTIEDDLGTNLIGTLSSDSDMATFHVAPDPEAPNGVNEIHVSAIGAHPGTTQINFTFYNRYIGF